MKAVKFLMIAALLIVGNAAYAQFANPTPGMNKTGGGSGVIVKDCKNYNRFNFSYYSLNFSGKNVDDDMETNDPGFRVGWLGGYALSSSSPLFIESGLDLLFNTKNIEIEDDYYYEDYEDEIKIQMLSLAIPIHLAYKLSFTNSAYISPYAGLHFKVNVLANEKYDGETFSYFDEDDMDMNGETFKRFQMGWRIGANVGYKAFNFNVGYMSDFTPLFSHRKTKLNTAGFVVGLGVNF